jgi:acyl-CoA reductase-like NAD-dependent aldehyde dehydrogenase
VLVHRDVHDAFVDELAAGVNALRVGTGTIPTWRGVTDIFGGAT